MSRGGSENDRRLPELLAGRALGDLSPQEEMELAATGLSAQQIRLGEELELTAAVIDQMQSESASSPDAESEMLPSDVRDKIAQQAQSFLKTMRDDSFGPSRQAPRLSHDLSTTGEQQLGRARAPAWNWREALAWLACAASLLIALGLWQRQASVPLVAQDLTAARTELLRQDPSSLQVAFGPGKTPFPRDVQGDVVWSNRRQQGYLRLRGIPANDPTLEQYQLWIIDPARDDEPIDGGVFDITTDGETIIPIDAKLLAVDPQAFAITIEKPGGVVVSTQERLPLLAVVSN